ncbi:MAG: sigma-70 family RNA polymerase sigma factor [Pyrinomonadaceae bacterium]
MYEVQANASTLLMIGRREDNTSLLAVEPSAEAVLVNAVLEGDREQFARLYDLYARMVHGILLARVPRDEVDDLVQDIFLHALRKLHTLRNAAAFGSWIAMIARNRAMDFHRNSRPTMQLDGDAAEAGGPESNPTLAGQILDMIRGLPDAYRETLVLRLVEGMTGPEIAERTGLTPASVRVNLHRGMKLLRTKLGSKEGL